MSIDDEINEERISSISTLQTKIVVSKKKIKDEKQVRMIKRRQTDMALRHHNVEYQSLATRAVELPIRGLTMQSKHKK
jgi:PIN domain nuclease of toxin-antitoxin system